MTKLIMDPNKTGWTLPQTISQGSNYTDPAGRTGVVNFDTATGKPLTAGQTTIIPSYQNLISNVSQSGGTVPTQLAPITSVSPKIMSFTQALIQILKDAQGKNQTGQAGLMNQSNQIKGLGLNDATTNFANPLLAPNDATSLGMSAQNEFDPSLNSIADQQKLATQNLGNITDLVNMTGDNYQKEQDRIAKAKQDAIDNTKKSSNVTFDTEGNISATSAKLSSIKGVDNYVDPYVWAQLRDLWQAHGGSDSSFLSNFKRFVNPISYDLVGIGTAGGA